MRIRAGTEADLVAVLELERAVERAPHWPAKAYADMLAGRGCCLFVAEEDGALAGFAAGVVAGTDGELEMVAVRADARGQGIGRSLVETVVQWARDAGARKVMLEVRAGSAGARRLYQRVGFVEAGFRPRYYADPEEDAVMMQCVVERCVNGITAR